MIFNHSSGRRPVLSILSIVLLAALVGLSGCGKKPRHVDPPETVARDTFPQIYPDLSTDPKP